MLKETKLKGAASNGMSMPALRPQKEAQLCYIALHPRLNMNRPVIVQFKGLIFCWLDSL
uniref:Uncharacterized protein n=1 Tax=Arundo donax TaxID=35708 RepID=A0A0A9GY47_ARUDO